MRAALALLAAILALPALAQGIDDARAVNAMRDRARAQERQADSLRQIERIERDRAVREDREQRNAARDARSSRRFDH